jgi:hypothetical protein
VNIESNDAPGWADEASKFEGKKAHPGYKIEHRHACVDVWRHDRGRILNQTSEGSSE